MPSMATVDRVDIMGAGWVLVVEKEVFLGVFSQPLNINQDS